MKDFSETVIGLLSQGKTTLAGAGIENARQEAEILLAFSIGVGYKDLLVQLDQPVSAGAARKYAQLVEKRREKHPLQYLTGIQEFMSLAFEVNEAVLVPRWDTESLVELVLDKMKHFAAPAVVDVGTGSGAIVVSLAKYYPQGEYYAVDISQDALEVARRNALRHDVAGKITFLQGNLLEPFLGGGDYDIVVSNPPYIPQKELPYLPADVQKEPRLALDGGEDGLSCYRLLVPQAQRVLKPGGFIFLEIGDHQGEDVSALCRSYGFSNVTISQDYGHRDRVVSGHLKR
ncbi:peptide chain release factor N(5)-glutamine methyltransferase [Candidatus Formimonas warabiya]|uniref:peptide chain release factor N(5)-glutamine methyltransferase n=1 Tax=Formimonas warabiya TaxID=1761012 RepID=UPI0011D0FE2C|nr:peptide chain release factor N(5)-glutamine methyltransferase [Candidatus Formimonas warabiya]